MDKKILQAIVLVALVVFVAGCSSEDSAATDQNTNLGDQKDVVASTALKDVLAHKIKYSADYEISAAGQKQTMTISYDLPKYASVMKTAYGDVKSIFDGTTFYSCTNMQGTWTCYKMAVQQQSSDKLEADVNSGSVIPAYEGQCSVAGEKGRKYSMTYDGGKTSVCYTSDGILLDMSSDSYSMTATKVSRSLPSDAFTVPAAATELPIG